MLEKLKTLADEYNQLQLSLQEEAVFNDPIKVAKISKKLATLETAHRLYKEYVECQQSLKDSVDMKADPDMHELAVEEEAVTREKLQKLEAEIQLALIPKNPLDQRNAILEVRAGTGGDEAALFAAELLRMYIRYAENMGWQSTLIDKTDSDAGGVKEAIL